MQRPALTKVRVRLEMVQTLVVVEVITGVKPLDAVAVRVYGNWVLFSEVGGAKVMVCESLRIARGAVISNLYLPTDE